MPDINEQFGAEPPGENLVAAHAAKVQVAEVSDIARRMMRPIVPRKQPDEVAPGGKSETGDEPDPRAAAPATALATAGAVASDVGQGMIEAPLQLISGATEGLVNEPLKIIREVSRSLNERVADFGTLEFSSEGITWKSGVPEDEALFQAPTADEADSTTGQFLRELSRFAAAFVGAGKFVKPMGSGATGQVSTAAIKGFMADLTDDADQRLSTLLKEHTDLEGPVLEYLAGDADDGALETRLKNAVEGLGLGVGFDTLLAGLKQMRAIRAGADHVDDAIADVAEVAPGTPRVERAEMERELGGGFDNLLEVRPVSDAAGDAVIDGVGRNDLFINFSRIDTTDDVKSVIQDAADALKGDIDEARRGTQSWRQTQLSAEKLDAWDVLAQRRKGEALNAEQSFAARELWVQSGAKVQELAQRVREAPTSANLFAFRKMMATHHAIQQEVIAARTETARALNAWAIPVGESAEVARQIDNVLEQMGGPMFREETADIANRISLLADAGFDKELDEFVNRSAWARGGDAVAQAWYFSLLSGPHTHARNIISNASVLGLQALERKGANLLGQALGRENVPNGEATQYVLGLVEGVKDALRISAKGRQVAAAAARQATRGDSAGARETLAENAGEFGTVYQSAATGKTGIGIGKVELPRPGAFRLEALAPDRTSAFNRMLDIIDTATPIPARGIASGALSTVDAITQIPTRALAAADEFFKSSNYRGELRARAYRMAIEEVNASRIDEGALKERMQELMDAPPEAMRMAAADNATYATFTQVPKDKSIDSALRGISGIPVLGRIVLPFRRTPLNLFSFTFQRTPLAPLTAQFREDMAKGGAVRDVALARMYMGSGALLALADLAMSGHITGNGPVDRRELATLRRTGWQPNSVRIPLEDGTHRYFSYRGLEPIAAALTMASNVTEILMNTDAEQQDIDVEDAILATSFSIAQSLAGPFFMSGLTSFFEAFSDPKRYGESWWSRLAGTVVPTGVATVTRAMDPYSRHAMSMLDSIRRRTPGLSDDLPVNRDLWGRPISYRSDLGTLYDALSPIYASRENAEPIDKWLTENEVWLSKPPKRVSFQTDAGSVQINLEQYPAAYSRYVELAGNALAEDEHGVPVDPLSQAGAKDTLNSLVNGSHPMSQVWELMSDGTDGGKADHVRGVVRDFRRVARDQLLVEFPELAEEVEKRGSQIPSDFDF